MLDFNIYNYPISPDYLAGARDINSKLEYQDPRDYNTLSRYLKSKRIFDSNFGVSYHVTPKKQYIGKNREDPYVTVDVKYENRLDIIANDYYGYSVYWWIIAVANDILDPFNVPIGTVLRIPQLPSLYSEGSILA